MITWLLLILFAPTENIDTYSCVWCGVILDMFLFGQIYQKIEKAIDKRRKNHQNDFIQEKGKK